MTTENEVPDLTGLDEAYANAEVKEGERSFDPIPSGKYEVGVKDVQFTTTKTPPPRPMLSWTLEITGPTHAGRLLWLNQLLVTPENVRYLKNDLHVCGVKLEKLSDLAANLHRLQGLALAVSVKTKGENTNVYIDKLIAASSEPEEDSIPF